MSKFNLAVGTGGMAAPCGTKLKKSVVEYEAEPLLVKVASVSFTHLSNKLLVNTEPLEVVLPPLLTLDKASSASTTDSS